MNNKQTETTAQPRKGLKTAFQNMRLQTRLILLLLLISIPILVITILALTLRGQNYIRQTTSAQLQQVNQAIYTKTETWFKMNKGVVTQMATLDGIISLDAVQQTPMLKATTKAFPEIFLAHTTDAKGFNIARNDDQENRDYSDRIWYQMAASGAPLTAEVLISRTTNQPALNMSAPIKDASGNIIGVMSIVTNLTSISNDVLVFGSGASNSEMMTFIVDPTNKLVAHPDTTLTENVSELADFSSFPPVVALRRGITGAYEFTDSEDEEWFAYISVMENGWGVITLQNKRVATFPLTMNLFTSLMLLIAGSLVLLLAAYFLLRYTLRPVHELTDAVTAMAAGKMSGEVPVRREDEIGHLARAFNVMNAQIRDNITNLEDRVNERTHALTTSTEVSRRLSTILKLDELTHEVANELKQAFNYYHAHIYLFDEAEEHLVMVGGSGEAGQIMQARGHKIQAGKGLVGRAASTNAPVLVSDTTLDAGWLPNPLLPETRSELAVPIAIGERVLGVLDVQQNTVNGLTQADADLVQAIANQVAVAVQNARAYEQVEKQANREALVTSINQRIQRATTVDEVLQIAVSELGRGLGAQRASVEVKSQTDLSDRKN